MFKPVSLQIDFPAQERELLKKWYDEGIVERYLKRNDNAAERFSFLDGPITANNPMGVHHGWGRTYKDLWQRFWNMRGRAQRFQNGFDCQGLWVEVEVEKELGIRNKKDIENIVPGDKKASIAKFVQLCKDRVLKFSAIQTEQSKRLGYFMDWDNSYYTMSDENNYAIWQFLKVVHEKGWIYKGRDSVPWCPRCETAISQHEMLTEDYKELTHETVFVKLPITTPGWENTSLLIWTTTPWTVPANVAVGVNTKFTYAVWKNKTTGEQIIILDRDENGEVPKRELKKKAMSISEYIFTAVEGEFEKEKELKGNELLGLRYEGPFDHLPLVENVRKEQLDTFHTVVDGSEIITSDEGTGLLHVAPGAGKEDFDLGKKEKLSVIAPITDDASYTDGMGEFSGKNAKKHPELILDYLREKDDGKYFLKTMHYTHRYPACWRCKTELVWKVADEWYIAMDRHDASGKTYREQMIEVAKQVTWMPEWGRDRELDWLKNMHDWLISKKNRYWGLSLPIYECQKCGSFEVVGSKEELKERAVSGWDEFEGKTPHKPFIDDVKIKCLKCGEIVSRIDDVGNPWLDAGIVPFSTMPEEWYPADFITESFPGQFKNWFYSLIAMATALKNEAPMKNLLGYASVLAEDGRAMHKSWGNAIEFNEGADKMGVDIMRWMYVTADPEQNLLFGYKKADETRRKFHLMLWNIYNFFITYATIDGWDAGKEQSAKSEGQNVLDRWILSRLHETIYIVTGSLEQYDAQKAAHSIEGFVNDLSLWYVRRSRDRVGPTAENGDDKNATYQTLYIVLVKLTKLLAPFNPFIADAIYTNLTNEESVHLADWPEFDETLIDRHLNVQMSAIRGAVERVHALRKKNKIKVRQPLKEIIYLGDEKDIPLNQFDKLILDETNVKEINRKRYDEVSKRANFEAGYDHPVYLNIDITPELKAEGEARELVRQIQEERKKLGTSMDERVNVTLPDWPSEFEEYIKRNALIEKLEKGDTLTVNRKS